MTHIMSDEEDKEKDVKVNYFHNLKGQNPSTLNDIITITCCFLIPDDAVIRYRNIHLTSPFLIIVFFYLRATNLFKIFNL